MRWLIIILLLTSCLSEKELEIKKSMRFMPEHVRHFIGPSIKSYYDSICKQPGLTTHEKDSLLYTYIGRCQLNLSPKQRMRMKKHFDKITFNKNK